MIGVNIKTGLSKSGINEEGKEKLAELSTAITAAVSEWLKKDAGNLLFLFAAERVAVVIELATADDLKTANVVMFDDKTEVN